MKTFGCVLIVLFVVNMISGEFREKKDEEKIVRCGMTIYYTHMNYCIDYFAALGKRNVETSEGKSENSLLIFVDFVSKDQPCKTKQLAVQHNKRICPRGKSLLKIAYVIFVILKSHDFFCVIFCDFSDLY